MVRRYAHNVEHVGSNPTPVSTNLQTNSNDIAGINKTIERTPRCRGVEWNLETRAHAHVVQKSRKTMGNQERQVAELPQNSLPSLAQLF